MFAFLNEPLRLIHFVQFLNQKLGNWRRFINNYSINLNPFHLNPKSNVISCMGSVFILIKYFISLFSVSTSPAGEIASPHSNKLIFLNYISPQANSLTPAPNNQVLL